MLGIGPSELVVIIIVAVLVLGPEHLPRVIRTMNKLMSEFRSISTDLQRNINLEYDEPPRKSQAPLARPESNTSQDAAGMNNQDAPFSSANTSKKAMQQEAAFPSTPKVQSKTTSENKYALMRHPQAGRRGKAPIGAAGRIRSASQKRNSTKAAGESHKRHTS